LCWGGARAPHPRTSAGDEPTARVNLDGARLYASNPMQPRPLPYSDPSIALPSWQVRRPSRNRRAANARRSADAPEPPPNEPPPTELPCRRTSRCRTSRRRPSCRRPSCRRPRYRRPTDRAAEQAAAKRTAVAARAAAKPPSNDPVDPLSPELVAGWGRLGLDVGLRGAGGEGGGDSWWSGRIKLPRFFLISDS